MLAVFLMLMVFLASAVADDDKQKSAVPAANNSPTEAKQCT
jgi:hypothetical protein